MIKFWTIAIILFIISTVIIAKFSLNKFRKEAGEKNWKVWTGRGTYWQLVSLCSFGIAMIIMYGLHLLKVPIF